MEAQRPTKHKRECLVKIITPKEQIRKFFFEKHLDFLTSVPQQRLQEMILTSCLKGNSGKMVDYAEGGPVHRTTYSQYLYRQINDKKVKETIDFLLNREEAHNAMFREAFNKVQSTGSNRDFGTTKAAKMYFSMSEPSPQNSSFSNTEVTPPSFN